MITPSQPKPPSPILEKLNQPEMAKLQAATEFIDDYLNALKPGDSFMGVYWDRLKARLGSRKFQETYDQNKETLIDVLERLTILVEDKFGTGTYPLSELAFDSDAYKFEIAKSLADIAF